MAANLYLLLHYLWFKPSFGVWSYLLLAYILSTGVVTFAYTAITRFRLPYYDYTTNNELQLLEQANPDMYLQRRRELYGALVDDRRRLEELGYLQPQT
jgi:hypothetical protein